MSYYNMSDIHIEIMVMSLGSILLVITVGDFSFPFEIAKLQN